MKKKEVKQQKKFFQRMMEILSSIFAVIVIIVCLGTLVFKIIFKVEVIKIFGYSGLIVLTGSMEPNYHAGDVIIIKELEDYNVRDVITFHQRNMIVTHRIIKKEGTTFTTQGDANNSSDEPIQLSDIEGKVIRRIGKIGSIILFAKTPMGIISLLTVLIALEIFFAAKRKMVQQ